MVKDYNDDVDDKEWKIIFEKHHLPLLLPHSLNNNNNLLLSTLHCTVLKQKSGVLCVPLCLLCNLTFMLFVCTFLMFYANASISLSSSTSSSSSLYVLVQQTTQWCTQHLITFTNKLQPRCCRGEILGKF